MKIMQTITVPKETIEELEKEPIVQESPTFRNFLNKVKEMYEIEIQMSPKEIQLLTEMLNTGSVKTPTHLNETAEYLTVGDVSKLLGISPQMVRRKCNDKKIKAWRTTGETGEWRIDIYQYKDDPRYSSRLEDILKRNATKKIRKQKVTNALNDISQMDGFSGMIKSIDQE